MIYSKKLILIASIVFTLATVNLHAEVWKWHYLPHVAAGGGWTSYLTISDPHGVASRSIWVYFYGDNGQALTLNVDGTPKSVFDFQLAANEEKSFAITSTGSTLTGQVQIAGQGIETLNASLRFALADGAGRLTDAVGVLPAVPNFEWDLAIDKRSSNDDMGVAIANPWTTTSPIDVTFDLYQNGVRVAGATPVTREISSLGHFAGFVSSLFPSANFSGVATLKISGSTCISAMALRGDGSQYSSLSVNADVQHWSINNVGLSGTETWAWRFSDGYTFLGYGTNPDNTSSGYRIRGVLAKDLTTPYFLAEWNYTDSSDGSEGVMIYQGTPGKEGGQDVINGTRVKLRSDGINVYQTTFKATRLP
jgi:hypothetical protein